MPSMTAIEACQAILSIGLCHDLFWWPLQVFLAAGLLGGWLHFWTAYVIAICMSGRHGYAISLGV